MSDVDLLEVTSPRAAVKALDRAEPGLQDELDEAVTEALRGSQEAARRYVKTYRTLTQRLLLRAQSAKPSLLKQNEAGDFCIVDPSGACEPIALKALTVFAIEAPFTVWVEVTGRQGSGVALEALARTRALLPGVKDLPVPRSRLPRLFDSGAVMRFSELVIRELDEDGSEPARIQRLFELTTTDLARLFGVKRQAAAAWLSKGVPASRRPKLATIGAIADILSRHVKPSRIAAVVRRPAVAYEGKSMLELIAEDKHEWLLESLRDTFTFSNTA